LNKSKISSVTLTDFLPPGADSLVTTWLQQSPVKVRLVRPRRTKLGDFRTGTAHTAPAITLNANLHPVEMLVTLAHELAHFRVYDRYKTRRKPHGREWKMTFRALLMEVLEAEILNGDIQKALIHCYFKRERIGSGTCQVLHGLIHPADLKLRVQDLKEGDAFLLRGGKGFILGVKNRTRYRCREIKSGKIYTVHPMAEVITILSPDVVNATTKG